MYNKAVLEPWVSPAFAITYFCNHCNIRFENTKYVDTLTPFFPKTWTKGHWPLDDLWPHVCWGHMCDSTQGSLCPSPMTIHQCMWMQWSILQNTTYIHTNILHLHTYHRHTTYRMSDHIVSYWTQFRWDKNQGSYNGESALHAILPSHMEVSPFTSRFLLYKIFGKNVATVISAVCAETIWRYNGLFQIKNNHPL